MGVQNPQSTEKNRIILCVDQQVLSEVEHNVFALLQKVQV